MTKQSLLRASPWIAAAVLIAAGAGCSAEPTGSGNDTAEPPAGGGGAGRAGVGGVGGVPGGGSGHGGAFAAGGSAASPTVSGGAPQGSGAAGGASGGSNGGLSGTSGGAVTTAGGATGTGGGAVAGGAGGLTGSGTGGGCGMGQAECNGVCIDVQSDPANCGACATACDVGRPCMGGVCQCPMGQTLCDGSCADIQNDAKHCGMCGNECMAGTPCQAGTCTQGGMCVNDNQTYNGRITWYVLATEMVGCHYPTSSLPQYYGAMNTADYLAGAVCGACVEVTNMQNGRKLNVLIADECPEESNQQWCYTGSHHIDLIQPAYNALGANNNPPITWRYVPCEPQGGVQYYFDKAAKQGYLAVSPMNHRYRITKMEVQGSGPWVELKRSYYNMWETTVQLGPGPYNFRVTDIHGHVIQDNGVEMKPAQVVSGVGQFATCGN